MISSRNGRRITLEEGRGEEWFFGQIVNKSAG